MGVCFIAVGERSLLPFFFLIFCQGVIVASESVVEESDSSTLMEVSVSGSSLTVTECVREMSVLLGFPGLVLQGGSCAVLCVWRVVSGRERGGVGGLVRGAGVG